MPAAVENKVSMSTVIFLILLHTLMKAKGTVGNTHKKKKKIEKNTTLYLHIFSSRLVNAVEGTDCKGKEKLWISA